MMPILISNRQKKVAVNIQRIRKYLEKAMKMLDCIDKEISVLLVDDADIRKINQQYLERDYSTNVISFSLSAGEYGDINANMLGDIVISLETALRDAKESETSFVDEMDFLMLHGLLHLLGYNHEDTSADEAEKMHSKEREIFFDLKGYMIE